MRLGDSKNGAKECIVQISARAFHEYLLAKFGFDTAENEPRKVCPLSVYRFLLLLQIPKVGEMLIAGPLHLGVPKSTPGSPSFEATHLVAESGRPGRPELLAKKGRIVGGVGCPPNCRTSGKL